MATPKKLYSNHEEIEIDVKIKEETVEPTNTLIPLDNSQMFENIKNIFSQEQVITRKDVYFVLGKGVFEFSLDSTIFMPSKSILLQSKKLEDLYLKELESIIYNSKEQLDIDKLLPLIILFSHINKKRYPIRLVSSNYRKLLPRMCSTLNYFLNKNYAVIRGIYETFNSIKDSDEERMSASQAIHKLNRDSNVK